MPSNSILLGILLGLDSLAVGTGLGAAIPDRNRRRWLALSFALCDGLASWIGSGTRLGRFRSSLEWCDWVGPTAVASYGLYVLYQALRCKGLAAKPGAGRWLVFGLPVCLSLDNLFTGVGSELTGASAALIASGFGAISGTMAILGMHAGSVLNARGGIPAGWVGGTLLVLVAGGLFLKESLA